MSRVVVTVGTLGPLVLTLLTGCAEPPPQQASIEPPPPITAKAEVDRAVATTGDRIRFTLEVEHDPALEVDMPEPLTEIAGFRVVDLGSERTPGADGRVAESRWYELRADLVGSYVLPALTVPYRPREVDGEGGAEGAGGQVETSALFVEVESVLPAEGEASDIRDIKPLRPAPPVVWWRWALPAAALAILALGLIFWWRRRAARVPPPIAAHEWAFAALDGLRQTDFADAEQVRRFYFAISGVLRGYVERRFGLNATDLTTEEILSAARFPADLDSAQGDRLRRFLISTDAVKYAAREPSSDEIRDVYEQALAFVEATVPRESEPEAHDAV